MSNPVSMLRNIVKKLGHRNPSGNAHLGAQSGRLDEAGPARPGQPGTARISSKGHRSQVKWRRYGEAAQTPSNLM